METVMPSRVRVMLFGSLVAACVCLVLPVAAQRPAVDPSTAPEGFSTANLRGWLSVIAADGMQGREIFSEGAGIASAYIADQLRAFGVELVMTDRISRPSACSV
jgi:hypothetical protein